MKISAAQLKSSNSLDDRLERARAIRPQLEAQAFATERAGRVSAETTALLKQAGLMNLGQPARFGGAECTPSQMLRAGFEIGRGCGSTAWCMMISNMASLFVSNFSLEAQNDIWGENADNLICGVPVPIGTYTVVPGGYEVQPGKWPFGSNSDNSEWCFVGARRIDGEGGGPPEIGVFLLPREDIEIDHDSWNVSGMQGTGSKTIVINEPKFIPAHRYLNFADVISGKTPGAAIESNPMVLFNITTFGAVGFVAPILGMAQGGLDWFVGKMTDKVKTKSFVGGPPSKVAETAGAQFAVGEASAAIDAAKLLLLDALENAETKLFSGQTVEVRDRVNVRRAFSYASVQASKAINQLFEAGGASSAALACPLQRHWRDINMAARHVSIDPQVTFSMVGQERFGLEITAAY